MAQDQFKKDNPLMFTAWEMAGAYDNNRVNGDLTPEGHMHLARIFGAVDEDNRGDVFVMFLSMLDERGIEYDVDEFMTEETTH